MLGFSLGQARCSGLLGQRLLESEWGHWIPLRIVVRGLGYVRLAILTQTGYFFGRPFAPGFPLSADERGGYGRTDPIITRKPQTFIYHETGRIYREESLK